MIFVFNILYYNYIFNNLIEPVEIKADNNNASTSTIKKRLEKLYTRLDKLYTD